MKNIQQIFEHALDTSNTNTKTYSPDQIKAGMMCIIDSLSETPNIAQHSKEFLIAQNFDNEMKSSNISFLILDMVNHLIKKGAYDEKTKGAHSKSEFSRLTTNFIIDTIENQPPENIRYLLNRFNEFYMPNQLDKIPT